jgi:peptidoglycan/xylan/chitin deacetylase (PgdA/CDA1 family)
MYAILLYHGIEDLERSARKMDGVDREYVLDLRRFESHIAYLASKPPASVRAVISFDDGDLSGYTMAAPVLERHGLRGSFFVVTRWIGTPGFMSAEQLRDLASRGHGVHSHSRTHPRLSSMAPAQIEDELKGSKDDLEAVLGAPVTQFSIPGGSYDNRVLDIARSAGYTTVMNSFEGYNDDASDAFLLKRFTPRAYSDASMLAAICEHPARTRARLALKRAAIKAARGVMGGIGYGKLREVIISRRPGAPHSTRRR